MLGAMEPDQQRQHHDPHDPGDRASTPSPPSAPGASQPVNSPETTSGGPNSAENQAAQPQGTLARRLGASLAKMFSTPARTAALGEVPDHQSEEAFDPFPVLHPISMGFLATIGVGLALGGYYVLTNVGSLLTWIAIALFIALGLDPVVRFLMRRGLSRPLAVVATMVGMLGIFGGFMALIIPTLVNQITTFITRAPDIVADFLNSQWVREIDQQYALSERVTTEVDRFFGDSGAVTNVFGGVLGVSQTVAQSMFGVLIVLVLAIYFLASLPGMMGFSLRLAPRSKRERVAELAERITRSVGNYVMGQATVAAHAQT